MGRKRNLKAAGTSSSCWEAGLGESWWLSFDSKLSLFILNSSSFNSNYTSLGANIWFWKLQELLPDPATGFFESDVVYSVNKLFKCSRLPHKKFLGSFLEVCGVGMEDPVAVTGTESSGSTSKPQLCPWKAPAASWWLLTENRSFKT